jgi:hypothetical protein
MSGTDRNDQLIVIVVLIIEVELLGIDDECWTLAGR